MLPYTNKYIFKSKADIYILQLFHHMTIYEGKLDTVNKDGLVSLVAAS